MREVNHDRNHVLQLFGNLILLVAVTFRDLGKHLAKTWQNTCSFSRTTSTQLTVRKLCFLNTSPLQSPCKDLVSALRSHCRYTAWCYGRSVFKAWQTRCKYLADHLQILPSDERWSPDAWCASIANCSQTHGKCLATTWCMHCEEEADSLQDVMVNYFPDQGKHVAKIWQNICEITIFHAQHYTAQCSLESTLVHQMHVQNHDRNHVLQVFGNLILLPAVAFRDLGKHLAKTWQITCSVSRTTSTQLTVRELWFLVTRPWQSPCEGLVSALRSHCRCSEGVYGGAITNPWQRRCKNLAHHLQILHCDEFSSLDAVCASFAYCSQTHGNCIATTWCLHFEVVANALQDIMAK